MVRTIAEIEADIETARAAISAVAKAGQSYTINSGGSVRQVTLADMASLRSWLADLQQELRDIQGIGAMVVGAGW